MPRSAITLILVLTLAPTGLCAQDFPHLQIPTTGIRSEGNSATSYPWGTTNGCRVMQAYDQFSLNPTQRRPVRITGIAFRPDSSLRLLQGSRWGIRVDVSTCRRPAGDLDRRFDRNHGIDRTNVFVDVVEVPGMVLSSAPHDFHIRIPFERSFTWDPACGPLLLDIISSGGAAGQLVGLTDGHAETSGRFGRIAHTSDPVGQVANFPRSGTQGFAPVINLAIDASTVPSALAATEGNSASERPWAPAQRFSEMRVQQIYEGGVTGLRGYHRIHSLAWRTDASRFFAGSLTYAIRVTLSTGRAGLSRRPSRSFVSNTGPDAKVVYEGDWTPTWSGTRPFRPKPFSHQLFLQRPFDFNTNAGSLVVDIQLFGATGTLTNARFDGETGTGITFSRVYADDAEATTGTNDTFGLAMRIGSTRYRVLPPAFESGPGTVTSTPAPWSGPSRQRAMFAYDGAALHACRPIRIERLSFMPHFAIGPITYSATIDLSTGNAPAASVGTRFDSNHGADRVRAFDGRVSLPYELASPKRYRLDVELDQPFDWDPSNGPLIVDIRKTSDNGASRDGFAAVSGSGQGYCVAHGSDADATIADDGPRDLALALRIGGEACGALAIPFGAGCPGRSSLTPANSTIGLPMTGNREFAYALYFGPVLQPATLLIGFARQTTNLGIVGLPACNLELARGLITLPPATTDTTGAARIGQPIPLLPALDGASLFTQWFCLDRDAPGGATLSNGIELVFCHR